MNETISNKSKGRANAIDKHVGKRIKLRRSLLNLSQTDLANAIGVSFQQVQKYERGVNRVSAGRLYELSNTLDVPIDYFYNGISEEKPSSKNFDILDKDTRKLLTYFGAIQNKKLKKNIIEHVKTVSNIV